MGTKFFLMALVVVTATIQGCAPSEKVKVTSAREALLEDCTVTIFGLNDQKPANFESLATIKLGEKGLSVSCDRESVEESMRVEACRVGANAILIVKEKDPDLWSTCYRATAELVYVESL